jgi:hypothetical protein
MEEVDRDCFVVFVRREIGALERPEKAEQRLAAFPSYQEAARLAQEFRSNGQKCIIRSVGQSGVCD